MNADHHDQHDHTPKTWKRQKRTLRNDYNFMLFLLSCTSVLKLFTQQRQIENVTNSSQYLMVTFNRFWKRMMNHKADIWFVDTWNNQC